MNENMSQEILHSNPDDYTDEETVEIPGLEAAESVDAGPKLGVKARAAEGRRLVREEQLAPSGPRWLLWPGLPLEMCCARAISGTGSNMLLSDQRTSSGALLKRIIC